MLSINQPSRAAVSVRSASKTDRLNIKHLGTVDGFMLSIFMITVLARTSTLSLEPRHSQSNCPYWSMCQFTPQTWEGCHAIQQYKYSLPAIGKTFYNFYYIYQLDCCYCLFLVCCFHKAPEEEPPPRHAAVGLSSSFDPFPSPHMLVFLSTAAMSKTMR
jgi:hypothetical protein